MAQTGDDQMLVAMARHGDAAAFREIVERYKRQIYLITYDFTGNHHDAEDILQEVLIKAYRSLDSFRGESKFRTWLHRITINSCVDRKRRSALPITSSEEIADFTERFPTSDPGSNPEKSAELARIQKHIQDALQKLTPLERSVFILRNYNKLQLKEIAQVLDRSEGALER